MDTGSFSTKQMNLLGQADLKDLLAGGDHAKHFIQLSDVLQKLEAAQKELDISEDFRRGWLDPLKNELDVISKYVLTEADHGTFVTLPWFLVWVLSHQPWFALVLML
jgi:hypothetical protein